MNYPIEAIFKTVYDCTKEFKKNLANQKLLVIYEENKETKLCEIFFPASAFYHLTGLKAFDNKGNMYKAFNFYNDMLNGSINARNLKKKDKTTDLKIEVLPQLMKLDRNAKMTGLFFSSRISLETDQLVGGEKACMGFVVNEKYECYIPNTLLKEDIRQISINRGNIIAILKKKVFDKNYRNITYIKKEYELENVFKKKETFKEIDFKNIYSLDKVISNKINTYKAKP